jgi:hypothetical protein
MPREQRWIILATDGRHVTLGRDAAPTVAEVAQAASALTAIALTGWLVRLDGEYRPRRSKPVLTPIRSRAGATNRDWPTAMAAFEIMRRAAAPPKEQGHG